jgi:hypothetical protein
VKQLFTVAVILTVIATSSCTYPTTGPQASNGTPPPEFYLKQNYPNPFPDTTTIDYGVPATGGSGSTVTVIVYDRFHEAVRVLVYNRSHPSGTYTTRWDGKNARGINAPPGVYIIEMAGYSPESTLLRQIAVKNR